MARVWAGTGIGVALAALLCAAGPARAEQHGDGYGPRNADPRDYGGGQGQYVVVPPYYLPAPYPMPYAYGPPPAGYFPAPYAYPYPPRPLPPLRPAPYPYAPYGPGGY